MVCQCNSNSITWMEDESKQLRSGAPFIKAINAIHQCFSVWGWWDSFSFLLILAWFRMLFLRSGQALVWTSGGMPVWHSLPASLTSSIGHCCVWDDLFTLNFSLTGFTKYNGYYYEWKGSKENFLTKRLLIPLWSVCFLVWNVWCLSPLWKANSRHSSALIMMIFESKKWCFSWTQVSVSGGVDSTTL